MKRLRMTIVLAWAAMAAAGLTAPAQAQGAPVRLALQQGLVEGVERDGVVSFRNIPFAAAPVGPLRWRPPQAAPGWDGVRDATRFGPSCPQRMASAAAAGGVAHAQSEDCLQLNIFAPVGARGAPVMVWIHGGAYRIGSAVFALYDGAALAAQGVVVVTVNYRLGELGFFAHPALTAEAGADDPLGNYGLMDQVAALDWVRAHIAAVGGDPARVTVFGESAGGGSIVHLMTAPSAQGRFAQAIVQSGGGISLLPSLADAERAGRALAQRVGLSDAATAAQLRALPVERFAERAIGQGAGARTGPILDGRFLRDHAFRVFQAGRAVDVPLLIGANSNEASVMAALGVPGDAGPLYFGEDLPAAAAAYGRHLVREEMARQMIGDIWFVAPARWLAEQSAGGAPAYLYHFDYVAAAARDRLPGAGHGSEIPYIFKTWSQFAGLAAGFNAEDAAFAEGLSACWVAFARTGRPDCAQAPGWSAYSAKTPSTMVFGVKTRPEADFRRPQLDAVLHRFFKRQSPPR